MNVQILPMNPPYKLAWIMDEEYKEIHACHVKPVVAYAIVSDDDGGSLSFKTFPIVDGEIGNDQAVNVLVNRMYKILNLHPGGKISWSDFIIIGNNLGWNDPDEYNPVTSMEFFYNELKWQNVEIEDIPNVFVINVFEDEEKNGNVFFTSNDAWFCKGINIHKIKNEYTFLGEIQFLERRNPKACFLFVNAPENEYLTEEDLNVLRTSVHKIITSVNEFGFWKEDAAKNIVKLFKTKRIAIKEEILNAVLKNFDIPASLDYDLFEKEVWDYIQNLKILKETKDNCQSYYSLKLI